MARPGAILVLNAGSSSVKFAVFDAGMTRQIDGSATEIGGASVLRIGTARQDLALVTHAAALDAILAGLAQAGWPVARLAAAGHRVVHGGAALSAPARVTPQILAAIRACVPLAPLHNPHNLAAIEALADAAPGLPQTVSFDTGFHAGQSAQATTYPLPAPARQAGLRRYGFHGLSYAGLIRRLPDLSGQPLPQRLLALHLGNGASLAAILAGRSVATSMGYSPVSGLIMGTRVGEIDANAVLDLAATHGIEGAKRMLNHESGLKALSGGMSDMAALLADPSPEAAFAVEHFCYWVVRRAGEMIAAMGGLDALAFTGGIGEHAAPVRARIMAGLSWIGVRADETANAAHAGRVSAPGSPVPAWIVPADEERVIAEDSRAVLFT